MWWDWVNPSECAKADSSLAPWIHERGVQNWPGCVASWVENLSTCLVLLRSGWHRVVWISCTMSLIWGMMVWRSGWSLLFFTCPSMWCRKYGALHWLSQFKCGADWLWYGRTFNFVTYQSLSSKLSLLQYISPETSNKRVGHPVTESVPESDPYSASTQVTESSSGTKTDVEHTAPFPRNQASCLSICLKS